MTVSTGPAAEAQITRLPSDLSPPPWARQWVHAKSPPHTRRADGVELTLLRGSNASLVTAAVPWASALDAQRFEQRAAQAYRCIRDLLASIPHSHPVRFWNYLPAIHEPMDALRDRYMVFNAGRFAALSEWFGGPDHLPERLPAASGLGHQRDQLVIHCLAFEHPGQAVENPRQIPAFRYSTRYGPLPPCFARATIVNDPRDRNPSLLVAGTASIRGEQSVCPHDLTGQLQETVANLLALLGAADDSRQPALQAFTDLTVYYVNPRDAGYVQSAIRDTFTSSVRAHLVQADLCRADLLVEI